MNIKPYLMLAFAWLVYFSLHSLLASNFIKQYFNRRLGVYFQYYRLFYTILATITLLPVLYYNAMISSEILIPAHTIDIARFAGLVLATYSVIIIKHAFKNYSIRTFLRFTTSEDAQEPLRTDGILQRIRHPLYAGTILIFTGFWLFSPTLANLFTLVMIVIYIFVGIQLEEAKLIKTYGQRYEEYKKQVPMLIPSFRRKH